MCMARYFLRNGLTVIEEKKHSDTVTIEASVKSGSNYEKKGIRGVSHFIEHMVFEGTKNRKNSREISNEIESLGGELNAFTNNVRTSFYIKVPKKHFIKAVEILSDILINPLFRQEDMEKERKVILKEINIFNDESRYYQWILFLGYLYDNHPSKYPVYGSREDVANISRKQIISYFNRYYSACNTIISVVGDVPASKDVLEKYFGSFRQGKRQKAAEFHEKASSKPKITSIKRKNSNSYMVFGYKTVPRLHPDSYVLDVIQAIFGRGQSGKIFDEIRNKRGLAYEVGVQHECSTDFGYFAIYLSSDRENLMLIKKLILDEISRLDSLTEKEIRESIGYVEGKYILDNEDTQERADILNYWEMVQSADLERGYLKKIKKVTKSDILRAARKYLTKNYTMAVIEQH
ncbi:hypothetical protein GF323_07070 [Candidatus Woesearchaeota archaeon]|nr:hypothetical protein [Candidatus Woesearchaeota archaeon]